ncbi:glycoside hydrolase family 31 protein [Fervidibacillus halotolerans]|uniref:Glycoside hydrolase family 31 protein n=1 Tax=Fervidibacillus halotolerans TaxID=2980027 RepID=A0A9E8RWU0_9BACI|nr:TIM-barrel domain-containing protein [Fervidibacillus halotolerans]WAA12105.1 glycoside hydrolase family 31 protein [Fervidibacillus halotolerans]
MKMRKKEDDPKAMKKAIIKGKNYRFTVLTEKLIRLEYSEHGTFEDRATQTVINRKFPLPKFEVVERQDQLEIITDHFHLYYTYGPFSKHSLWIDVKNNYSHYRNRWYYGEPFETLKGTARTLDQVDGALPLEEGIQSKNGFSIIDDSKSCILANEETILPREPGQVDLYFFAHGRDYLAGLRDFYTLTGTTPLLPRFTLGNWWSRYWKYDEESYKNLIRRFQKEDIPFSVSVIDMDWHLVDIPEKYGSGWTGYTWNKELFPDPDRFLQWLHNQGMHVTLNVHPADGVRPHEEMYERMAKALGVDVEKEHPIPFDITDKKFRDAYFKFLHHPEEKRGVDFWWIDWQQGTTSKIPGADPLWLLNHFHSLDFQKRRKRPLILSRYAGVGSHRFPIGFSGDTVISWDSYRFQPYFTATASNIGYTWWSHDIGGHFEGEKDDELALRWLQFGVFSPIMRLHSSSSPFNGKEPWRYPEHISNIMKKYLRLRHQFVPYLYTMNWRTHRNEHPLMMPMYYLYPMENEAYEVPNQYFFGSELIVAPVTEKIDRDLQLAPVTLWLPEGNWIDFFTGRMYKGGGKLKLFRGLEQIPIFAKEGAIVPLAKHQPGKNTIENPTELEIIVFPGKSNTFSLYEDDGMSLEYETGHFVETKMEWNWEEKTFTIDSAEGDRSVIPEKRNIWIHFRGVQDWKHVKVQVDGKTIPVKGQYDTETNTYTFIVENWNVKTKLAVQIVDENIMKTEHDYKEGIFQLLNRAQISFPLKDRIYKIVNETDDKWKIIRQLRTMDLSEMLFDAILEELV